MNIECPQCGHSSNKPIQDNKDFRQFSKDLFDKEGEHIRSEEWIICSECGYEDNQLAFDVLESKNDTMP